MSGGTRPIWCGDEGGPLFCLLFCMLLSFQLMVHILSLCCICIYLFSVLYLSHKKKWLLPLHPLHTCFYHLYMADSCWFYPSVDYLTLQRKGPQLADAFCITSQERCKADTLQQASCHKHVTSVPSQVRNDCVHVVMSIFILINIHKNWDIISKVDFQWNVCILIKNKRSISSVLVILWILLLFFVWMKGLFTLGQRLSNRSLLPMQLLANLLVTQDYSSVPLLALHYCISHKLVSLSAHCS